MRIAVIGGGLSGVATAFYLINQQAGKVDLFESDEQLGGRAGSELLGKRRVDFGGKNIGKHYQRFREFAQACGNPDYEYFGINTSQLINGRIISLSRDRAKLYNALKLARLCGLRGIRQIYPHLKAILADRNQGVLASEFFRKISDQFDHITLAQFFSSPCVNNLIRPITIRMNGAEPEECYPGNFGSNLSIAIDSYEQLTEGMHWLLDRFKSKHESKSLKILTGHRVHSITNDSGSIMIGYQHRDTLGEARYDKVISALPAHALAILLEKSLPETSGLLQKVQYYPVGIAIAKYRDEVFPENRRAMIFDRGTPLSNAGAYGVNDLDMVRYTFSGKTSRKLISENSDPEKVIELGEKITTPFFNIKDNFKEGFVYRYFTKGLCAYSSKHHLLLDKIDVNLKSIPGFRATGDYRRGASIEACFRAACECVDKVIGD